jgi:hypothetical protein
MPIEKTPPRFVPTLTEVVAVQTDTVPAEPPPSAPPSSAADIEDDDALLRRLGADLDRRISEAIARALHEQMLGFNSRVRRVVADVVREAVANAFAQDEEPDKS